jgi:hypothetical protein
MMVYIPTIVNGAAVVFQPMSDAESIAKFIGTPGENKENQIHHNLMTLMNKPPTWNAQVGAYVLNFHGRVTRASVKNFQLVNVEEPNRIILQFGRIEGEVFTMDVRYPMSIRQAFAICLSSFDYKFSVE